MFTQKFIKLQVQRFMSYRGDKETDKQYRRRYRGQ